MTDRYLDYNQIAETYNERYQVRQMTGVAVALADILVEAQPERVLEVGCGTGRWLEEFAPAVESIAGLDPSMGMMRHTPHIDGVHLVCGRGERLPFARNSFDMVYVVNALHHFSEQERFFHEARRILRSDSTLAIIGLDVLETCGGWMVYEYFPETYERDCERFPTWEQVALWMQAAGLTPQSPRVVQRTQYDRHGRKVLEDPFMRKHATSQLALLTDNEYEAGMARVRAAIDAAEAQGNVAVFRVDLTLKMLVGRVP